MANVFTIVGPVQWSWTKNNDNMWIAECLALAQVVQADSFSEMLRTIEEVSNQLMQSLYEEGELDQFLRERGFSLAQALPQPITTEPTPQFEVPFELLNEMERRRAFGARA